MKERLGIQRFSSSRLRAAKKVARAIINTLKPIKERCHTITSDNGKEFAEHQMISEKLGIDFYFADPYSSWQRGANENYNGLLRQYFPEKTSLENVT